MKALLALGIAVALALAQAGAAAQGGGGRGALRQDRMGQDLDAAQLLARWIQLRVEGEPEAAMQLGESVVAAGGTLAQQIWSRSVLAADRIDHGQFERARVLIAEAAERTTSFLWRAAPDGGSTGYAKYNALNQLQRAQCLMATRLFRPDEAAVACAASLDSARKARELQRFSGHSKATADGHVLHALIDRAHAERLAGRSATARQVLLQARELVDGGSTGRGATASFYRTASQLALDMGDKQQARDWARRAVDIWPAEDEGGVHTARLKGRNAWQRALVFSGDWQAAIEEFDSFDSATRGSRVATNARFNMVARALAYAHAGRLPLLQARLRHGVAKWRERMGAEHPFTAMLEGLLGAALIAPAGADPQRAEGLALLTRAAETLLEAQRRGDPLPELGIEGLATRFVLEQFLRTRQSNPSPPESRASILAFQVADFLRGSRVQGAIQDAAVRSAATAAGLGDLVRREQDARNEVRSLQDLLAGRTAEGEELPAEGAVAAARQRVQELESSGAALRAQIAKAFPKYDALVRPKLPGTAEVIRQLALGEAFVLMLPVEDGVHLWALTWTDQSYRFAALPPAQLARAVDALRASTDLGDGKVKAFAHDAAWQLYRDLLAPLDKQLAGARHLIVAGGGVLGSVPFAALLTAPPQGLASADPPWLARRMAVSQVPGASAWLAIQRLGAGARPQEALMAWGDPTFAVSSSAATPASAGTRQVLGPTTRGDAAAAAAPRYADLPALPETRDELLAIAATLKADPGRDLLLGGRATRASVLAANDSGALVTRRVLAFATHGLMAGDLPNLDQPALAMAATADAERDPLAPLLKLDDVLGLKLNADWVVLSACNTAATDGRAEEALSGLARGFFYAGARSLLVTHWAVETESAKLLTTRTFEHYAANPYAGKAESLRQAMLQVMAQPKYAHPAFWAPYALVGDGAR